MSKITVDIFDAQANIVSITLDVNSIKKVKKNKNNALCTIITDACSFIAVSTFEEVANQIKALIPDAKWK